MRDFDGRFGVGSLLRKQWRRGVRFNWNGEPQRSNGATIPLSDRIRWPKTAHCAMDGDGSRLRPGCQARERARGITRATIGKVVDLGLSDPFNMGGAMAPAAVDTIIRHFTDFNLSPNEYDLIITGDLGKIGLAATYDLLREKGFQIGEEQIVDCGLSIYGDDQKVQAGASGTASSAVATYGYFLEKLKSGELNSLLVVATGSLHSPLSVQQNETIPCIAHAVAIERSSIT